MAGPCGPPTSTKREVTGNLAESYSFEELIGTSAEDIPDFAALLKQCSTYKESVSSIISPEEQQSALTVATRFGQVIHNQQFRPLLLEIAVIQDKRLLIERNGSGKPADGAYFVSSIVSFCEPQESPRLLSAWHASMQRILNKDFHATPQPIVAHEDTYKSAYLVDTFDWAVDAIERRLKLEEAVATTIADPRWLEKLVERQAHLRRNVVTVEALVAGLTPIGLLSEAPPTLTELPTPAVHQSRYAYSPVTRVHSVHRSIASLTLGFLWDLVSSQVQRDNPIDVELLLDYLHSAYLLIVPFRRPIVPPSPRLAQNRGAAGASGDNPGGCLFAVLEPRLNQPVEPAHLHQLAIRLSWLLFRAALREAHAEIDVRRGQEHAMATVTHFLPTEIGRVKDSVRQLRAALSPPSGTEEFAALASEALDRLQRLDDIAAFAIRAWKVSESHASPEGLTSALSASEFETLANQLLRDAWPVAARLARRPELLGKGQTEAPTIAGLRTEVIIEYHETYLRVIISELLINAMKHSQRNTLPVQSVSLDAQGDGQVYLLFRNPIDSAKADGIRAKLLSGGKTGLLTLRLGAEAVGLTGPDLGPSESDDAFSAEASVGRWKLCPSQS